ncbi:MAG TPA: phosphoribosylaminoimidazolesuccinocarboxamide synthase [Opitutales bacterium]|nr:phosphoribosylaminoimidazolesuccinocarboxamide synthase [Opitutales bacterium]
MPWSYDQIKAALPREALTRIEGLPWPKIGSGKVRELFDAGDALLIVATDRLSAFDVILPDGIPGKGILLTQLSLWWFARTARLTPNHVLPNHDAEVAKRLKDFPRLQGRSMFVRKLRPLPVEAVVRGYLAGSGLKAYKETGRLFDQVIPAGLGESDQLPQPIFTPTSKANAGHDEPLTGTQCAALLGAQRYVEVRELSLKLFELGTREAARAGLILADTKFEFGTDADGKLYLIDEVLTPDSSRYWPADSYQPGRAQMAFDKQYVRDHLETLKWNKTPPGPHLPAEIIGQTQRRYLEAVERLLRS